SVEPLPTVLRSPVPSFYEPRLGTSRSDSTVPVLYQLAQPADTVWLIFEADPMDSASLLSDTLSPHILRLVGSLAREGLHNFSLDGREIGSNSPYVAESNRGAEDHLVTPCIYNVTLMAGDTLGNDNATATNNGYVWPNDRMTVPPVVIEPRTGKRVGESFRVLFSLPEEPYPGSVYLSFVEFGISSDPASPHRVYLGNIPRGNTVFYLDARQFTNTDVVDSVQGAGTPEQNNTLVHGAVYTLRLQYRDHLGNPAAVSAASVISFDVRTDAPQLLAPLAGDTLPRINLPVRFRQPEHAYLGSLRLIFTQTGGVETDLGSPHVLYLSNRLPSLDTGKVIIVQPSALYASSGVDSTQGGAELLIRSIYRLTVEYRDTLANTAASARVDGLVYSSGTAVSVRGGSVGTAAVAPGDLRVVSFWLGLRTDGGNSVLRALKFTTLGDASTTDLVLSETSLWQSVDTLFVEGEDVLLNHPDRWSGGILPFDSLSVPLNEEETILLVTLAFAGNADLSHSLGLQLAGPSAIDCGTDPVYSASWPLGREDYALNVELTSFATEQDTLFGALRVWWIVASESDNAGFVLYRRTEEEEGFRMIASYATAPELVGRGWNPTATRYQYVDRGLTPGTKYYYRLRAVSSSFHEQEFEAIAEGIPQVPPTNFILGDAYPNPFNQEVTFRYVVPYTAKVEITIYDILGRKMRSLVRALQPPAEYRARWDSRNDEGMLVPSGIYFYRMEAGGSFEETRKLVLIR
ncbi:T9SS type A sorting domain-containing protein, partial [bacterium]|nr:T9SS type A sorting domain-containing protein [bacterium]